MRRESPHLLLPYYPFHSTKWIPRAKFYVKYGWHMKGATSRKMMQCPKIYVNPLSFKIAITRQDENGVKKSQLILDLALGQTAR